MDKLIKATAMNGEVRIVAAQTTELVNKAVRLHGCAAGAAVAFGRMLTAGTIVGSMLKAEQDKLTLQIDGGGPIKGISVTAFADAHVKGYVGNPAADLPLNEKGKVDVGGLVGREGSLMVIRDMGLREPYVGQSPIVSGEIGDDLAYYYTVSEQTPSAVGLGVLIDTDYSIKAAGGFLVQMMPDASEMVADLVTYRLEEMDSITDMMSRGMSMEDIIKYVFEDMQLNILESMTPEYRCDCSREIVEKALISIGEQELKELYEEGKIEELQCQYCSEKYLFTKEDFERILEEIKK